MSFTDRCYHLWVVVRLGLVQLGNVRLQLQLLGGRIVVAGHIECVVVVVDRTVLAGIRAKLEHILVEWFHLAFMRYRLDVVFVRVWRLEKAALSNVRKDN